MPNDNKEFQLIAPYVRLFLDDKLSSLKVSLEEGQQTNLSEAEKKAWTVLTDAMKLIFKSFKQTLSDAHDDNSPRIKKNIKAYSMQQNSTTLNFWIPDEADRKLFAGKLKETFPQLIQKETEKNLQTAHTYNPSAGGVPRTPFSTQLEKK